MKGWYTKHQEFTQAGGDPTTINNLIAEFNLKEIVSYDEANGLITTTIQHDQYIRLSDLISLNTQNVIAFTALQFSDVINQLEQSLQNFKKSNIQHGNLKMENILLDFTQSESSLDAKPQEITFQLKLINFAELNKQPIMQDDYTMTNLIHIKILELSPESKNYLKFQNISENSQKKSWLNLKYVYSYIPVSLPQKINPRTYLGNYCWDSNFFIQFTSNYNKFPPLLKNCDQINILISQLHQYHLIINNYQQIHDYSYLKTWIKTQLPYSSQPQDLVKACALIDQIFDLSYLDNSYKFKNYQFTIAIETHKFQIQNELIMYLKLKGYFQDITNFLKIIENIDDINNYISHLDLPNEIIKPFGKSSIILVKICFIDQFEMQINNNNLESNFNQQCWIINRITLIKYLNQIKKIGYKYCELLIDHFINTSLEKELKDLKPKNRDIRIQLMVDGWLTWIDQYIFDKQFSSEEQLASINKEIFIQFIEQGGGFQLLQQEMKNCIEDIVEQIFESIQI